MFKAEKGRLRATLTALLQYLKTIIEEAEMPSSERYMVIG